MKRAGAAGGGAEEEPGAAGVSGRSPAATLMVQGTASGVGKSVVATALCRLLAEDGLRVAPFKAQNMSLNSAVTPDGAEIGRSQALQAEAAGIVPTAHNNPVLLKPAGGGRCQVVVHGRVRATVDFADNPDPAGRAVLWRAIRTSLQVLRSQYEAVVIEGAGSPAELNLRGRDLANMRTARLAGAPVLLVADISRGGVFAALAGTLHLLPPSDRRRVVGLVVNNFHGDPAFFREGAALLQRRTRRPVLGVLPHLADLGLDEEDAEALRPPPPPGAGPLRIAVVRLPHLSNSTDTDVLRFEPDVDLVYTADRADLAGAALVVLPGSKDTLADLDWLERTGLAAELGRLAAGGARLIGLCGGYQMLGRTVRDPHGVESPLGERRGLGLLEVETVLRADKRTRQVIGSVAAPGPLRGVPVGGYEIHMGDTARAPGVPAFARLTAHGEPEWEDGAVGAEGRVAGTYVHGLFDNDALRRDLLNLLRAERGLPPLPRQVRAAARREAALARLATAVRAHLDVPALYRLAGLAPKPRAAGWP